MKDGGDRGKRRHGGRLWLQRLPENSWSADQESARGEELHPLRLRRGHMARGEGDHGRRQGGELAHPARQECGVRHQQLHQAAGELREQVLPSGLHRRDAGADLQLVVLLGALPERRGQGLRPGVRHRLRRAAPRAAGGGHPVRGGGGRPRRHHLQLHPSPGCQGGAGGTRRPTDFSQTGQSLVLPAGPGLSVPGHRQRPLAPTVRWKDTARYGDDQALIFCLTWALFKLGLWPS